MMSRLLVSLLASLAWFALICLNLLIRASPGSSEKIPIGQLYFFWKWFIIWLPCSRSLCIVGVKFIDSKSSSSWETFSYSATSTKSLERIRERILSNFSMISMFTPVISESLSLFLKNLWATFPVIYEPWPSLTSDKSILNASFIFSCRLITSGWLRSSDGWLRSSDTAQREQKYIF